MKTKIIRTVVLLFLAAGAGFAQETPNAKVARLLTGSGVKFTKVDNGIWTVPFTGKQLPDFNVIVAAEKEVLVMFVMLVDQKQFRPAPELLRKLLAHNDEFDRVKI